MKSGAFLLALILSARLGHAQSGDTVPIQQIDAYITRTMRSTRFQGVAVGIVKGDRVVYRRPTTKAVRL